MNIDVRLQIIYKKYISSITMQILNKIGTVVIVIAWLLDLQLHMPPVPITTEAVSSNLVRGEVY